MLADGEPGYALWLAVDAEFWSRTGSADERFAGREMPAPSQECGRVGASSGLLWGLAGSHRLPAIRASPTSGFNLSARPEPLQSASSVL